MIEESLGQSLRDLRESRHISLRTLAECSGFSPSFLSQVENGQASPSISSMERIAKALGVTLAQFFRQAEKTRASVIHREERSRLSLEWSHAEIESVGTLEGGNRRLYAFVVTLNVGGLSGKHSAPSNDDEFGFVNSGQVLLTLDGVEHTLVAGDTAMIPAGVLRRWQNDSTEPVQILIVSARRPS